MSRRVLAALWLAALGAAFTVQAGSVYTAISPSAGDRTVTLTGRDLTIEQIVLEIGRASCRERV